MRWLAILGVLLGFYYFFLMQLTNHVLAQAQYLQKQYTYIADHADEIATGKQ